MKDIEQNSLKAWMLAVRPKTLTGAATPVLIGSAYAFSDNSFRWKQAAVCLLFALLMQIAANLINDLFDFLKGTDRTDRLGPERACAQGWISQTAMEKGIIITIAIACMVGSTLLYYTGWELLGIGVCCVIFAYLYTAGPYPLAYHGWGDVLVLLFFGLIPVCCTYYVQTGTCTSGIVLASTACGMAIDTLLIINNYRDRDTDASSGKHTLIVRFGEPFGRYFYLFSGILAALLCLPLVQEGKTYAALLPQLYLMPHFLTWRKMVRIHQGKQLNRILGETSRNILIMGLLLSVGLMLQ